MSTLRLGHRVSSQVERRRFHVQSRTESTMQAIQGIHHITAMASDPQRNVNFYVNILGQRFIKKTVNFDDPGTYH
ncbi:MAG: VOC family protein, partial [Caldilineaceae bacterium]|nr:VOC family protein [Caldilineaceae bacterium]